MKRILTILVFSMAILLAHSQAVDEIYDQSSSHKAASSTRAERRAKQQRLKTLNDSVAHNRAARALERGQWVLQADRVSLGGAAHTATGMNENANFVFQQGDQAMVQVAFNGANPGLNGLGGVTVQGRVTNARLRQGDNGELYYNFHISGADINAEVMVTVYRETGQATAIVSHTFGPAELTLHGRVLPYRRPTK